MTTPIKFDKRLHDKNFKSGELSRDDLTAHLSELPDLSDEFRYRITEEEVTEDDNGGTEEGATEGEVNTGAGHEQG